MSSIGTFKNVAIVVYGKKSNTLNAEALPGKRLFPNENEESLTFRLIKQGRRTAWSSNATAQSITDGVLTRMPFIQGADIMPRTLVFHKAICQPNGKWNITPLPRKGDVLSYLVSNEKKNKGFAVTAHNVDDIFMYECFLSKHILPFIACAPAKALLPMKKNGSVYTVINEAEIASLGSGSSAVFAKIFAETGENAAQYFDRVNTRNKLNPQHFTSCSDSMHLVMVGAGGGYPCAAYVPMSKLNLEKTIIDQTLYWYIASSEDEALYICALLNSRALNEIIADFQPVGAMGRRHVHTLPYAVTPTYDSSNPAHVLVVEKARALMAQIENEGNDKLSVVARHVAPSQSTLAVRRRKVREFIVSLPESIEYEDACKSVYN